MDVAEYRRKYEAELELAAREKVSFRDLLGSVRAGQPEALGTVADVDDLTAAVAVIRDSGADIQLKAAALQLISLDIDKNPELYGPLLELLGDGTASPDARMAVLNLMQQISFGAASFRATWRPCGRSSPTPTSSCASRPSAFSRSRRTSTSNGA
jgi:hypothetical protein